MILLDCLYNFEIIAIYQFVKHNTIAYCSNILKHESPPRTLLALSPASPVCGSFELCYCRFSRSRRWYTCDQVKPACIRTQPSTSEFHSRSRSRTQYHERVNPARKPRESAGISLCEIQGPFGVLNSLNRCQRYASPATYRKKSQFLAQNAFNYISMSPKRPRVVIWQGRTTGCDSIRRVTLCVQSSYWPELQLIGARGPFFTSCSSNSRFPEGSCCCALNRRTCPERVHISFSSSGRSCPLPNT